MIKLVYLEKLHFTLLHSKCALVQEGSRNGTTMGMSTLTLVHLTITCTKQFIVKLDFISYMIYDAMPPYGGYRR